jgi:8-oxo-dGTP diphosphatase
MAQPQRPLIGVGVIIHDKAGNIIMGQRAGSHGAGNKHPSVSFLTYNQMLFLL